VSNSKEFEERKESILLALTFVESLVLDGSEDVISATLSMLEPRELVSALAEISAIMMIQNVGILNDFGVETDVKNYVNGMRNYVMSRPEPKVG
jgi:hypothetical protein